VAIAGLGHLLDPETLRGRAGDRTFQRGQHYAAEGRVTGMVGEGDDLSGTVAGTDDYGVRLWLDGDELAASCDCPVGEDGVFCKHMVALALAWLDEEAVPPEPDQKLTRPRPARPRRVTLDDIRTHLEGLDHAKLVELVLAQADRDDSLREHLALRVAMADATGAGVDLVMRAIDQAVRAPDFIRYADTYGYARGIDAAIDLVEEILQDGSAAVAIEVCEHALGRIERAMESVDDSDGAMGGLLERVQELHLAACEVARPDPVNLATRLFAWELGDEWDVFSGAALTYADVLGEAGLAEYRRRAEVEWAKVPPLTPGAEVGRSFGDRRFRITSIMASLARASGNVDELVAIMSRDLSSPYAFLEIARVCLEASRADEALEWAERGMLAFPGTPDGRLRAFLAELYHQRSRHNEAIALIWAAFEDGPTPEGFLLLKAHAERIDAWPVWRARAFGTAREAVARAQETARPARFRWDLPVDGSALARMHLSEGDLDAAWREATALGCSERVWRELARRREADHPADAIPIYQREVEALLGTKRNDGYAAAVELLGHIRGLMVTLGAEAEFAGYLATVRAAHGRKRNFTSMLAAMGW
jgi:uncharacterized Zn finger protein